jgi:hypothetical protein
MPIFRASSLFRYRRKVSHAIFKLCIQYAYRWSISILFGIHIVRASGLFRYGIKGSFTLFILFVCLSLEHQVYYYCRYTFRYTILIHRFRKRSLQMREKRFVYLPIVRVATFLFVGPPVFSDMFCDTEIGI